MSSATLRSRLTSASNGPAKPFRRPVSRLRPPGGGKGASELRKSAEALAAFCGPLRQRPVGFDSRLRAGSELPSDAGRSPRQSNERESAIVRPLEQGIALPCRVGLGPLSDTADKGGSDALVEFGPKRAFQRRHLLRRYAGGRSHRDICPAGAMRPTWPMAWSHRFEEVAAAGGMAAGRNEGRRRVSRRRRRASQAGGYARGTRM